MPSTARSHRARFAAAGLVLTTLNVLPVQWVELAITAWTTAMNASVGVFSGGTMLLVLGTANSRLHTRCQGFSSDKNQALQPLRWWRIALIASGFATVTAVTLGWLASLVTQPAIPLGLAQSRTETVHAALTFGAGLLGVVILTLIASSQCRTEPTHPDSATETTHHEHLAQG